MREQQIAQENSQMKQVSISSFMDSLDNNKSVKVIEEMVSMVENGVFTFHEGVQRKRAAFFPVTKDLTFSEVAYIGLKGLLGVMSVTQSMSVVSIGQKIGDLLFIAGGRTDEIFSLDEKIIKQKASAGIKLLDIVLHSLPVGYFRSSCERISATRSQWVVEVGAGFDKIRKKNSEVFTIFTKKLSPLMCQPDDWKGMTGGGYLSDLGKKIAPLVKRSPNHATPEGDLLYTAINHLQKTPFRVHAKIFEVCQKLKAERPKEMKKVFMRDLGEFKEKDPLTTEDQYVWEKERGLKENKKTGKTKEADVMVHTDEASVQMRKDHFKWRARKAQHKKKELGRKSIDKSFATTLELTDSLKDLENIYWAYQVDRRSRVYPSAMTGINLQGADYQKAVVEFSIGLPIESEDGVYAIKKTLCNHWGGDSGNGVKTDKLTRKQVEKWLSEASRWIITCTDDPLVNKKWMSADKPLQFLAAAMEWAAWIAYSQNNEDKYSFISRLPDPNDASCSGAQILSAMTRDNVGAMHTNLKDMEVQDLYMACAAKATENLMSIVRAGGENKEVAQDWLGRSNIIKAVIQVNSGEKNEVLTDESHETILKLHDEGLTPQEIHDEIYFKLSSVEQQRMSLIIRNLVKKPVMVKFYSGTRYGNIEHCNVFIVEESWEDNFRAEGIGAIAAFMGNLIYDAINQVISGAGLVMEWFVHVADILGSKNIPVKWKTPVIGFNATMSKHALKDINLEMTFRNTTVKFLIKVPIKILTDNGWEYKLDTSKMKSGIAPDIVHSLDAALIMLVSFRCAKEGIDNLLMIHDSLASHCCFSSKFNRIIREEFVNMFKEDVLFNMYKGFLSQLSEKDRHLLKSPKGFGIHMGTYKLEEVLESEFSFH
jgi:DNA-directed RNA polymerase